MTLLDSTVRLASPRRSDASDPRDPWARLERLFDDGTIQPLHTDTGTGVVSACGDVDGIATVAFASDATVQGGAMGSEGCSAIVEAYDVAIEHGVPIVGVWHSGGARLAE